MTDRTVNARFDDDRLDDLLTGVARPRPGLGFADRVLSRTRLPLPRWLVPTRDWIRGVTSGVTGWLALAILALATAGGWATVGSVAWRERALIGRASDIAGAELAGPAAQAVGGLREVLVDRVIAWLPLGLPVLKFILILYAAVAVVSALGLWWLMRTPRTAEVPHA